MTSTLEKLLAIASPALGSQLTHLPEEITAPGGVFGKELAALLLRKNGFVVFEGALHVFPIGQVRQGYDLAQWNSDALWRSEYGTLAEGCLFFAEDVFGEQFCIRDNRVWRFVSETGDQTEVASCLEGWAQRILEDYEMETGYPLAHAWQQQHGPLLLGQRLLPKIPFVLGGDYDLSNLYVADAIEGMRFRGYLARQIHDLPDGAQIRLRVTDT